MTTIPKMLSCLVSEQKTTYLAGCLMQMYFFYSLGITEDCVLTAMAIDSWILSLWLPPVLPEISWIATLPFCDSNQTQQIFCDSTPVLRLACTDTSLVVIVDAIREVEILASFLVITLSYNRIIV
ncbi:Olfactory receptor 6K6, partial [Eschrichtius robustus]|nr:Olfactory receptor 6K6 [Eschrichtius robustus]